MKRVILSSSNQNIESAILSKFGSSNPGTGCTFIANDGTFVNIYPKIDVHEDLCYWVEDNLGEVIDCPDEEWAIREFGWIRLRKDPHMCIVELPSSRPTNAQWYSLEDWLSYVEDSFSATGVELYLGVCDGADSDVEYRFGKEYFTEDIVTICKRYYTSGKLYASSVINQAKIIASDSISFGPSCPFTRSTDTSYYDNFLNEKDLEYMRNSKNRDGEVVMMSPREYYQECSNIIFKGRKGIDGLKEEREWSKSDDGRRLVDKYATDMERGDKFPLPYLNYADKGQEGLHRMYAAGEAFGWDTKFPVLIVTTVDERQEELNDIWRWWCKAVNDAEDMTYDPDNWEEEFVEEVEYNLEHDLEKHYDVEIVSRRTPEECEKYQCEYAIEIALSEFADIMRPQTIFTPNLREVRDSSSEDVDDLIIDDIDLDDIDWDELLFK